MILHLLYILAFTALAFLAVGNLIRNLMTLGVESQRQYPPVKQNRPTPHPELLDEHGRMIDEPLLVMRSMSVEDAREQLDAIYKSSPGGESAQSGDE
ncbi:MULTISPECIES: DUF2973 domain-containing protein [Leptolyngbya]|jgi:hypothetical protein|uniref:DUF2973 domain-containing protein n=1 Tax=Leptolyngbya boryana NIES-2135 TaxID=1973484 RepID=A0A1Z4JKQ9_LEPBY|nr:MULTISPECIES: DUF2973 domain-containing protein [Leptolyngbya]MBN8563693.1 DUF2973 domain-containing protein [Leptolyngbya sp. UWPOB_LEPTO1]BAS56516.1 Protein of unknown function (DUF2973) [Leptolyngbya boryana IAM M-101]BAS62864.1 Protein of unknown function (DUF2973) [Leptolyngbya boryana dg5]BAY57306.1 hypothetical protein NIES2135_41710 [Leptolyngbya boryana NIES-2135]